MPVVPLFWIRDSDHPGAALVATTLRDRELLAREVIRYDCNKVLRKVMPVANSS